MRRRGSECVTRDSAWHAYVSPGWQSAVPPQRKCPSQRVECYSGGRSVGVLSKTCHIDSSPRTSLCLWQFRSEGPASDFLWGRGGRRRNLFPVSVPVRLSNACFDLRSRLSRGLFRVYLCGSPRRGGGYPHPSMRDNSTAKFPRLGGGWRYGYVARS